MFASTSTFSIWLKNAKSLFEHTEHRMWKCRKSCTRTGAFECAGGHASEASTPLGLEHYQHDSTRTRCREGIFIFYALLTIGGLVVFRGLVRREADLTFGLPT